MKLPRDWSGEELARRLGRIGYTVIRQTGSHMRVAIEVPRPHRVTIPRHDSLRIGTLAAILDDVAGFLEVTREELLNRLI